MNNDPWFSSKLRETYDFSVQDTEVKSYYNADRRLLDVYVRVRRDSTKKDGHAVLLKTDEQKLRDYVGQNVYGAGANVASSIRSEYLVDFENFEQFPTVATWDVTAPGEKELLVLWAPPNDPQLFFQISTEPSTARSLRTNPQVIIRCKVNAPYIKSDVGNHSPTISEPYDLKTIFEYLQSNVEKILVYDAASGGLVGTIAPTEKKPIITPQPDASYCSPAKDEPRCRRFLAQSQEKSWGKNIPNLKVAASGVNETVFLLTAEAFKNKKYRLNFVMDQSLHGAKPLLCRYGFKQMVLEWNKNPSGRNEVVDLGCS